MNLTEIIIKDLIALFILVVIIGFIVSKFMPNNEEKQNNLLSEIRDELKKKNKNKKDEPLEGEIIE